MCLVWPSGACSEPLAVGRSSLLIIDHETRIIALDNPSNLHDRQRDRRIFLPIYSALSEISSGPKTLLFALRARCTVGAVITSEIKWRWGKKTFAFDGEFDRVLFELLRRFPGSSACGKQESNVFRKDRVTMQIRVGSSVVKIRMCCPKGEISGSAQMSFWRGFSTAGYSRNFGLVKSLDGWSTYIYFLVPFSNQVFHFGLISSLHLLHIRNTSN